MRAGWELKKLVEVADIINGGTPKTGKKEFWDGEIYWITPADLGKLKKPTVSETPRRISKLGLEKSSAKLFNKNSVILSTRAPIGHLAINEVPMCTNQGCRGIVPSKNLDTWFLYYFLKSNVELLDSLGTGATFKELSTKALGGIQIPLPPLPEQQRIVALLDEAFAAIAKAKANAEQNLKNAKELFESLLIKIFIEGINIKKWELEKLEKFNKVVVGYVGPISNEYTNDENGILLLSTKNIGNKGVTLEKLTRINHQFHFKNKKSQLVPGDILVARHGNSGQSAVIPDNIKAAHALNVIVIKKSESLSSEYICFLLNSGVLDKIASSKGGSVQEIINTSVIKDLIIPVPSVNEQKTIVQKLDALSAESKKLEAIYTQKINDLEELKKSILQKAFAGELKTEVEVRL
jgi:type I restriction enzyme S subunit